MRGAWGEVELRRSATGSPLLAAATEPAAFYGLGYAQATDDLEGVLRQYLLVRGELATVDDDPAARDRDANQRLWRVGEEAEAAYLALPAAHQELYRAFIAGVRARMAEELERVPAWAPPLDPWLPIGVNRTVVLYWVICDAVAALRAEGVPLPPVVSELDRTPMIPGSNAWALTPPVTATGTSVLVSDPHLPFGDVYSLHEATVQTPTLHFTGFAFLGAMLPPLAHNADVAWGCTTGGPRASDAYRVPDTDAEAVELNGVRSPVIARQDGHAYAICSPYSGLTAETEAQFLAMLRARSAGELRATFDRLAFPPQNIMAVDRRGRSFYVRTGRVPRRPTGASGVLAPDQLWQGFLEPDELVHLDDPATGYLQNCNSAPDTATAGFDTGRWSAAAVNDVAGRHTSRSERSVELMAPASGADIAEVTRWAVEDYWPDTPVWREALAVAAASARDRIFAWDDERRSLLDLLLGFDGHASPDSIAATAWIDWRTTIARTPEPPDLLRERVDALDPELLLDALERTNPAAPRPYGELHRLPGGEPGRGGAFTVRPSAEGDMQPSVQAPLRVTYFNDGVAFAGGPALRIVRFDADGMTSWSQSLPRDAAAYSRAEVTRTAFRAEDAPLVRVLVAAE